MAYCAPTDRPALKEKYGKLLRMRNPLDRARYQKKAPFGKNNRGNRKKYKGASL